MLRSRPDAGARRSTQLFVEIICLLWTTVTYGSLSCGPDNPQLPEVTVGLGQTIKFKCSGGMTGAGSLQQVDWYVQGEFQSTTPLSGKFATASWSYTVPSMEPFAVTAAITAMENGEYFVCNTDWYVTVSPPRPPVILRVSPGTTDFSVAMGQSIDFEVNCSDQDGNLLEVDWSANGALEHSTPIFGSSGGASWNRTFYSPGTFTISAEVADDTALTNALAWNVFVPATPPLLTPSLHADELTIAWPADATGYVLEMSESLGPAALWRAVGGDVTVVNGQRTMSVVLSGPTMFFRLWRP